MQAQQVLNGRRVLWAVYDYGTAHKWPRGTMRYVAYLAVMCVLAESDLWIYANGSVPGSTDLPHDQVGSDHKSVGLFQQQVPMWGNARDCMDPATSTRNFLDALVRDAPIAPTRQPRPWTRIQAVQRSAVADGSNYHARWLEAYRFVVRYWNPVLGRPYGIRAVPYPVPAPK